MWNKTLQMPTADSALPGRDSAIMEPGVHFVSGNSMKPPFPAEMPTILFGMGCFWGAEKVFWNIEGVYVTAVGYAAGFTPNPTYKEVCSGMTGHNEVVLVVYDSSKISFPCLLKYFWENHDPTQGMRQGNDIGTQYRSGIYCETEEQLTVAQQSKTHYQRCLAAKSYSAITTEILPMPTFYFAEEYHQQYLAKNPMGYCGHGGCGIKYEELLYDK